MKRRSSRWFWAIAAATTATVAGAIVYMAVAGLDKTNALSAPMVVLETVILIGLTGMLLVKPEGSSDDTEASTQLPSRVSQRADRGGRNYSAGRDLTIHEAPKSDTK